MLDMFQVKAEATNSPAKTATNSPANTTPEEPLTAAATRLLINAVKIGHTAPSLMSRVRANAAAMQTEEVPPSEGPTQKWGPTARETQTAKKRKCVHTSSGRRGKAKEAGANRKEDDTSAGRR